MPNAISTPQTKTTKLFVAPLLNRHNKKKVNKVNADASSDVSPTPAGPGTAKRSSQKSKRPHDGDGNGDVAAIDEDLAQPKAKKSKKVNQSQLSELTNRMMDVDSAGNSDEELEREIARLKAIRAKKRADAAHHKVPGTGHSNANEAKTGVTAGKTAQKATATKAKHGFTNDKPVTTARTPFVTGPVMTASGKRREAIDKIPKPEGAPGESEEKGGFNVQIAARVDNDDDWNEFKNLLHQACAEAHIDFTRTYKAQDPDARKHVCQKIESKLPYFCKERFENYWVTEAMIQQYIKNVRRTAARKARKPREPVKRKGRFPVLIAPRIYQSDGEGNHTVIDDEVDPGEESDSSNHEGVPEDQDEAGNEANVADPSDSN
ncbi:hypothetical protein PQX77_021623 [Marasmius sp. AFHP31]|nr:hypothetical protein PQX77_021623 [Marasmius sp. AFHP31]